MASTAFIDQMVAISWLMNVDEPLTPESSLDLDLSLLRDHHYYHHDRRFTSVSESGSSLRWPEALVVARSAKHSANDIVPTIYLSGEAVKVDLGLDADDTRRSPGACLDLGARVRIFIR
jgi:hypothetical protein